MGNDWVQGIDWVRGMPFNPNADPQELFETVINELGELGNIVHAETSRLDGRTRLAYLTRVMGEVQALRIFIEQTNTGDWSMPERPTPMQKRPEVEQPELIQPPLLAVESTVRRYY